MGVSQEIDAVGLFGMRRLVWSCLDLMTKQRTGNAKGASLLRYMIFRYERVLVADWECGIGLRAWGGDINVTLPTNDHDANDY